MTVESGCIHSIDIICNVQAFYSLLFLTQLQCDIIQIRNTYLPITLAKLGFLVAPLKLSPVGRG